MRYSQSDLQKLQTVLYEILEEIHRICQNNNIPYFLLGGSAIGLYYDKAILPWDDDLDIGMTRDNYDKFIEVASKELNRKYFLSCIDTDAHTPFFYTKIKANGTLFVEERYKDVPMHHGIFVDVFPIDRMPNNSIARRCQCKIVNFLKCCLMSKEVWLWKYFGKCQLANPLPRLFLSCLLNRLFNIFFPKRAIYKMLVAASTFFNKSKSALWGSAVTNTDYIYDEELDNLRIVKFGSIQAYSVSDIKMFLLRNYPLLHRYTEDEVSGLSCDHAPILLKFNENE